MSDPLPPSAAPGASQPEANRTSAAARADVLSSIQAALGDAYTIERELGGGGMSRVFVATETALSRRVAVKVLSPELLQGVSAERFAREVALAAKLQDPHIVPVLTTGATPDGLPYFTMPFIEGESLRERMKQGPVPLEEAVRILRDVAEALEYAHARGIVHRDIKPENVLLSGRNAVVADFGIAKAVSAARESVPGGTLTSIGLSLGTPAYMAPEQAAGDAVDHRADVYAWGMMAYELLAGAHPFASRTSAAQLMAAQLSEMPKPLDEVRPGLPPSLGALVMQCVAKVPTERPADAAAVLAALGGATTDLAATTGRRAPVGTTAGRGRTLGIAAAVLVLVLGGGAWLFSRGDGAVAASAAETTPSVAVLPFEHQGDTADLYLTEGITDEIRNKLTGVSNLLVIARASSNQYRGTDKTPQAIAEELGVRWLLTGTVRVIGSGAERRVVVRPELVEVTADGRLQSRGGEPFEGPMADLVRAQGEVANQVVRSMEVAVGGADQTRLIAVPTRDAEAYDQYLRGMATIDGGANANVRTVKAALPFLERAVARDSGLVEAWRAIASSYSTLYALESPSPEYERRARAALTQIERVAPQSASFFRTRSLIRSRFEGDLEGSYADQQQAHRLDPSDPRIVGALGLREVLLGRFEDALQRYDEAIRLDPRLASLHATRGGALVRLRRLDEARAAYARARALAPASLQMVSVQLNGELSAGDVAGARRVLREAMADIPRDRLLAFVALYEDRWWLFEGADAERLLELPESSFDVGLGYHTVRAEVLHQRGDFARARAYADSAVRLFDDVLRDAPRDAQSHVLQGLMHAYAGRASEAMAALTRGLELGRVETGSEWSEILAYYHYTAARAAMLVGDRARAMEWVRSGLATRSYLTAGFVRLDPAFAPLLGDPAFERVLAEAP
jgi:serine/threonine-protein kinase